MKCPRCQQETAPQTRGRFRAWFVLGLAVLLTGCVVVPAKVKTSRSEVTPLRLEEGRKVAVLFSSDFSPETPGWLGEDMTECTGRALQEALPGGSVVREEKFYQAVFPGLTPRQVLLRTDTLPILVARPEIRQRLDQLGLHYLILVGAALRSDVNENPLSPLFYPWVTVPTHSWDERVKMTAVLFELGQAQAVGSATAEATGKGAVIGIVGGGTDALRPSCEALGFEVVRMIRGASEREGR